MVKASDFDNGSKNQVTWDQYSLIWGLQVQVLRRASFCHFSGSWFRSSRTMYLLFGASGQHPAEFYPTTVSVAKYHTMWKLKIRSIFATIWSWRIPKLSNPKGLPRQASSSSVSHRTPRPSVILPLRLQTYGNNNNYYIVMLKPIQHRRNLTAAIWPDWSIGQRYHHLTADYDHEVSNSTL
jgi:hypothetical protein